MAQQYLASDPFFKCIWFYEYSFFSDTLILHNTDFLIKFIAYQEIILHKTVKLQ